MKDEVLPVYVLPDGELTSDIAVYNRHWATLASEIEDRFPGFYVGGYDPDVLVFKNDASDQFELPTSAALALIRATVLREI